MVQTTNKESLSALYRLVAQKHVDLAETALALVSEVVISGTFYFAKLSANLSEMNPQMAKVQVDQFWFFYVTRPAIF